MTPDRLAARLLALFAGELDDLVAQLNAQLLALEAEPGNAERVRAVFRIVHTLKGAARAAGVPAVEQLCHRLETRLAAVRAGDSTLGPDDFTALFAAADSLAAEGRKLAGGGAAGGGAAGGEAAGGNAAGGEAAGNGPASRRPAAVPPAAVPPAAVPPAAVSPAAVSPAAVPPAAVPPAAVRVAASQLDALLASSGELLLASERARLRVTELEGVHERLARWGAAFRLAARRNRVAELAALDAELRRLLLESQQAGRRGARDAGAVQRLSGVLADEVRALRLQPLGDATEPLARTVRDIAAAEGKRTRLELSGEEIQADRAVIDALRDALLQLVRNAVDHGIEPPAERAAAGKPEAGTIEVAATLVAGRMVITVRDDGRGIDLAAVAAELRRRGETPPADPDRLVAVLLGGGLSTKPAPTLVSGRGVGLDTVRQTVERIGGTLEVATTQGAGTTFRIECSPSPTIIRAVLATAGPHAVALPTASVERLVRIRPGDVRHADGRNVVGLSDGAAPFAGLAELLGAESSAEPGRLGLPAAVLRAGERRLVLAVDALEAEQEIVVRPVAQARATGVGTGAGAGGLAIAGATLLPNGAVAIVLNAAALVAFHAGVATAAPAPVAAAAPTRRVLVVDDSFTTRALEESILAAAGYEVVTAVDGADAWERLRHEPFDAVVSDVEMPRMDGVELCAAVRGTQRLRELPFVLVTALESPGEQARGLEAGADAYLGKSSFSQQQLLETLRQLLG